MNLFIFNTDLTNFIAKNFRPLVNYLLIPLLSEQRFIVYTQISQKVTSI